jgi:hypothetical protein
MMDMAILQYRAILGVVDRRMEYLKEGVKVQSSKGSEPQYTHTRGLPLVPRPQIWIRKSCGPQSPKFGYQLAEIVLAVNDKGIS